MERVLAAAERQVDRLRQRESLHNAALVDARRQLAAIRGRASPAPSAPSEDSAGLVEYSMLPSICLW